MCLEIFLGEGSEFPGRGGRTFLQEQRKVTRAYSKVLLKDDQSSQSVIGLVSLREIDPSLKVIVQSGQKLKWVFRQFQVWKSGNGS